MQGRAGDAEPLLDRAVVLRPDYPTPHGLLGSIRMTGGRYTEALAEFEAATRLGDAAEGSWAGRAEALLRLGRAGEALVAARAAAARFPNSASTLEIFAKSADAAGKPHEAAAARARIAASRGGAHP
jgi:predicted Zn-dependent protease